MLQLLTYPEPSTQHRASSHHLHHDITIIPLLGAVAASLGSVGPFMFHVNGRLYFAMNLSLVLMFFMYGSRKIKREEAAAMEDY